MLVTLGAIVLRQLPNLDQWDWGRLEPRVYLGDYSLRGKGEEDWPPLLSQALKRI